MATYILSKRAYVYFFRLVSDGPVHRTLLESRKFHSKADALAEIEKVRLYSKKTFSLSRGRTKDGYWYYELKDDENIVIGRSRDYSNPRELNADQYEMRKVALEAELVDYGFD